MKDASDAAQFALRLFRDTGNVMRHATIPTEAVRLLGLEKARALQISAFMALMLVGLLFATARAKPSVYDSIVFMLLSVLFVCLLALPLAWLIRCFALGRTTDIFDEALSIALGFLVVSSLGGLAVLVGSSLFGFGLTKEELVPRILGGALATGIVTLMLRALTGGPSTGIKIAPIGFLLVLVLLSAGAALYLRLFLVMGLG